MATGKWTCRQRLKLKVSFIGSKQKQHFHLNLICIDISQGPTGTRFFSKSLPTMIDLALKQLKVDSTLIGNMFALPKKLIITEPGSQGNARLMNPGNSTAGSPGRLNN